MMKALTLTQPWATLVAIGAKQIETRSWKTDYRGPLAIHAAKGFPKEARALVLNDWKFYRALNPVEYERHKQSGFSLIPTEAGKAVIAKLPLGYVIATCTLSDVIHIENGDGTWPSIEDRVLSEQENTFGDYSHGRWAWILKDVKKLPEPIPSRGALSLWEWGPPS